MSETPNWRSARTFASSSGSSARGGFGVSSVQFRVGAPPLRPLPLKTSHDGVTREVSDRFGDKFSNQAKKILARHGVKKRRYEDVAIDILTRSVPGDPGTAQPTILIAAPWTPGAKEAWEKTVVDIKRYVDNHLHDSGFDSQCDVAVEMLAYELTKAKYMSPVLDDQTLEFDWRAIRESVFSILESFEQTRGHMTAISLFRLGYSQSGPSNPVTVYISLDYASSETTWPPVIRVIQDFLNNLAHRLVVHMEHNLMESFTFPLLMPEGSASQDAGEFAIRGEYKETVNLGSDIAPATFLVRAGGEERHADLGTLGCYVEVKTKSIPKWTRYGLTNYHVVRPCFRGFQLEAGPSCSSVEHAMPSIAGSPVPDSALMAADSKGFWPNATPAPCKVESPCRKKHFCTVHVLQTFLAAEAHTSANVEQERNELSEKIKFFDEDRHIFAQPWCGSGFKRRSGHNGRLDWALLQVLSPSRQGSNSLPSRQIWEAANFDLISRPLLDSMDAPLKEQDETLRTMKAGDRLYKFGARTGPSTGVYSSYKTDCNVKEDRHMKVGVSSEFVVMGKTGNGRTGKVFADQGDSGSIVFSSRGTAVGMVFRGQSPQQTQGEAYCLVTPIEDVFEDIKKFSKGGITDIRISPW